MSYAGVGTGRQRLCAGSMVRVSVLNDALKTMYNAEKRGKRQVLLRPSSKVVIKFLQVMMRHGECAGGLHWRFCLP